MTPSQKKMAQEAIITRAIDNGFDSSEIIASVMAMDVAELIETMNSYGICFTPFSQKPMSASEQRQIASTQKQLSLI